MSHRFPNKDWIKEKPLVTGNLIVKKVPKDELDELYGPRQPFIRGYDDRNRGVGFNSSNAQRNCFKSQRAILYRNSIEY